MQKKLAAALVLSLWASGLALADETNQGIDTFPTAAIAPMEGIASAARNAGVLVNEVEASGLGRPPSTMAFEMVNWDKFQSWRRDANSNTLGLVVSHCDPLSVSDVKTIRRGSSEAGILIAIGCPVESGDAINIHFMGHPVTDETGHAPATTRLPLISVSKSDCKTLERNALASSLSGVIVVADDGSADDCALGYFELLERTSDSPKDRARLKLARAEIMRQWLAVQ